MLGSESWYTLPNQGREGAVLGDEGDAIVARWLAPAAFDLRYNPHRYFSWDRATCACVLTIVQKFTDQ